MKKREKELIEKGKLYEAQIRGNLVDNCYRAGLLRDGKWGEQFTTEELKKMYEEQCSSLFGIN